MLCKGKNYIQVILDEFAVNICETHETLYTTHGLWCLQVYICLHLHQIQKDSFYGDYLVRNSTWLQSKLHFSTLSQRAYCCNIQNFANMLLLKDQDAIQINDGKYYPRNLGKYPWPYVEKHWCIHEMERHNCILKVSILSVEHGLPSIT